ncbi:prolyl oligopeptidase family serine peptidase [Flavobacterium psychrophilum]|nr:prolyl oligopeptidase family serine peptidase [Flavobacterium psychrophilum]
MKKTYLIFFFLYLGNIYSQNGKIISRTIVDLSKTPVWGKIAINDSLREEYKYLNKLNFYFIKYQSDELEVNGILLEPKKQGKYPVVIFNRGGNRAFGRLNVGTMILFTSKLAAEGYVIIGSDFREKDEFGGSEINDVLNLTETIKEVEKANSNNIGMFGWSRGGIMTYLALGKSDKIKSAIIGNSPTNLFELIKDRPEMETQVIAQCVPNYFNNKEIALKNRSVVFWADKLNKKSSLLILCGKNDERVNPKQADEIAEKLTKIKYNFELRKFETDHSFTGKENELNEVVIKWFNDKLKNSD